jgi:formate-dependent nitrite reductase membrane component NrfD
MAHEFNMDLTPQEEWSWLVAIDLFLGGMGGGLFLFYQIFGLSSSVALLSLALVVLGGLVLLSELGHPLRAWRALAKPFSSWISRGVIFVTLFLIFGALYVAPAFETFSSLPGASDPTARKTIGAIAGLSAFLVTLYPGFVLAASPSIPFWNSPLLPVLFASHSLLVASGIIFLLSASVVNGAALPAIRVVGEVLIVANFVLLAIYLATLKGSGLSAREAVRRLNQGPLGWTFRIGVVLIGMIVPLAVVLWLPSAAVFAGICILIGALLFRYCVLKAGVYVPFPIT